MSPIKKLWSTLLISTLLGGCLSESNKDKYMSEVDYEINTFCVGRYLMDVPKGFEPVLNLYAYINGVKISYLGVMDNEEFKHLLDKRASEIRSLEKPEWGESALVWTKRIGDLFILAYNKNYYEHDGGSLESYIKKNGHIFKLKASYLVDKQQIGADKLLAIADNIFPQASLPEMNAAGACIPGGYYTKALNGFEAYDLSFRDPSDVKASPYLKLEIRNGDNVQSLGYKTAVKNTGSRSVAGFEGIEYVSYQSSYLHSEDSWTYLAKAGLLSEKDKDGIKLMLLFKRIRRDINLQPYDIETSKVMWEQIIRSIRPLNKALKERK